MRILLLRLLQTLSLAEPTYIRKTVPKTGNYNHYCGGAKMRNERSIPTDNTLCASRPNRTDVTASLCSLNVESTVHGLTCMTCTSAPATAK